MQWYEADIRGLERDKKPKVKAGESVVFYGSSSIRLWEGLESEFPDYDVVNMGFGGSTLAGCGWFFDRVFGGIQPKALTLYAGDNDLGDGRHPEEVFLSFEALHGYVRAYFPEIPFTFISIKPSPARMYLVEKMRRLNNWISQSLAEGEKDQYLDVFTPMMQYGGDLSMLYAEDGLHMNAQGYSVWKSAILEHRAGVFGE